MMTRARRSWFGVLAGVVPVVILVAGCAETVSRDRLMSLQKRNWSDTVNSWWYTGTDGDYHYLYNETDMFPQKVRIHNGELRVKRTFPKTDDRDAWVRVPLGTFREDDPKLERDFFPDMHYLSELDHID